MPDKKYIVSLYKELLQQNKGLLSIKQKVSVSDGYALSLVYTPGVGENCLQIQKDIENRYLYTNIGNTIGVVTDGTNFPTRKYTNLDAYLPELEYQCLIYKNFCGIDAYPLLFSTQNPEQLLESLLALQGSMSAVELYNMKLQPEHTLHIASNKKSLRLAIVLPEFRESLTNYVTKSSLEPQHTDMLMSQILRVALDLKYFGIIPTQVIDKYFLDDSISYNCRQLQFSTYQKFVEIFYQLNLQNNNNKPKEEVIRDYSKYLVFGNGFQKNYFDQHLDADVKTKSLELHKKYVGMIKVSSKIKPQSIEQFLYIKYDSNLLQEIGDLIEKDPKLVGEYTCKANLCTIITNGTAILGFGDIGATEGLPVMEGKSCIFNQLGGTSVIPLCIQEKDPKKFIDICQRITHSFSGINLEDIKAPQCFEIEDTLKEKLNIPVFHDDQHGTAIVCGAAVYNALKLMEVQAKDVKLIINGGGAAGLSITRLLLDLGIKNIIICDTKGAIYKGRTENMNPQKNQLAQLTNPNNEQGLLQDVLQDADIFVGVSAAGALKPEWIPKMKKKNLVLAMANPNPEILPEEAKKAGVFIMGTGRSDFDNQVNNSLVFPGLFRGALEVQASQITNEMKLAATYAIANLISDEQLNPKYIIPGALDTRVPAVVAQAVGMKAMEQGINKVKKSAEELYLNVQNYIVQRENLHFKKQ